jgi:exportin-1
VLDVNKIGSEQYLILKNITMQVYKNYINQMLVVTNEMNLAERYFKLDDLKKLNFEEFCMQYALSLISFFKNNMPYIEEYDFYSGTSSGNDFSFTFLKEIYLGLNYLSQIHQIPSEEILKTTCEFWHWFSYKVCFLKEKDSDFDLGIPLGVYTSSLQQYIMYTQEMYFYKNCYSKVLETVRHTLITKMTKPIEVKIDIDEDGNLVLDPIINTIYQTLHETMRDSLIYLTHLDPLATEKIMLDLLQSQTIESNWNPNLLNSLCWSIGCITGAMDELHEKKFVVMVIKYLLNLCEMKKGKTNKAIVASNIMYVVGQYPRFLNAHWKFLKTVIKKLFEFMHELHPGVQDFACETFLKISLKCGDQIVIINESENEPYINVLVRSIKDDTADLQAHQKLMFYEAVGNMINKEHDIKKKTIYIQQMMQPTYNDWCGIFEQANQNPEILQHNLAIKALDLIIKINERVAFSVKTPYWSFGGYIYDNLIKAYMYYTGIINDALNANQNYIPAMKQFKSIKKTILKFIQTVINTNDSVETIMSSILPALSNLIEAYRYSNVDNRDPDILIVFAEILEKLKNSQYDYIVSIWNYLCLFTLDMIKSDFQSYPEHRQNFFILVKSLIANAFDALFQVQDSNFNKDVLNAIIWAIRHNQPLMYETGLETLLILIKNVNQNRMVNNINVADLFYKTFFFDLIQEILCVMTDSFHKAGFKLQIEIMQFLTQVIEFGQISEGLFDPNVPNKQFAINYLINIITNAFGHLNKIQIETFSIGLFNKCYNYHEFKILIRNFLTSLKSFAGENDELYEEEKKVFF